MTKAFAVAKSSVVLVAPCQSTPSGSRRLSQIDRNFSPGTFVEMMFVYKHGREPAKVVRDALSKALVAYYPLAGRLVRSERGEVEVACTGDGVWFINASADCSLEDVAWREGYPLMIPREELLSFPPDPPGMSIMMQVTQFLCGGVIVGFVFDHTIADAMGAVQFMTAVAEIARGLKDPTVEPVWCREAIPDPWRAPLGPPAAVSSTWPTFRNQYSHLDISSDRISQMKEQLLEQTGRAYSTFDILAAKVWQCRARSMNLEPNVIDTRLVFATNARKLLSHVLPNRGEGYYGNCVYLVKVTVPSGKVTRASTVDIMDMIKDSKRRVPMDFRRWCKGELEEDPYKLGPEYDMLFMADLTKVGFHEVDFGWGKPAYVTPMLENLPGAVAYLVRPPALQKGVRLITQLVAEKDLAKFKDQLEKAFSIDELISSAAAVKHEGLIFG